MKVGEMSLVLPTVVLDVSRFRCVLAQDRLKGEFIFTGCSCYDRRVASFFLKVNSVFLLQSSSPIAVVFVFTSAFSLRTGSQRGRKKYLASEASCLA